MKRVDLANYIVIIGLILFFALLIWSHYWNGPVVVEGMFSDANITINDTLQMTILNNTRSFVYPSRTAQVGNIGTWLSRTIFINSNSYAPSDVWFVAEFNETTRKVKTTNMGNSIGTQPTIAEIQAKLATKAITLSWDGTLPTETTIPASTTTAPASTTTIPASTTTIPSSTTTIPSSSSSASSSSSTSSSSSASPAAATSPTPAPALSQAQKDRMNAIYTDISNIAISIIDIVGYIPASISDISFGSITYIPYNKNNPVNQAIIDISMNLKSVPISKSDILSDIFADFNTHFPNLEVKSSQWTLKMQIPQGPKGKQGGPGDQGLDGLDGQRGLNGDQGPRGKPGNVGTNSYT